MRSPTRRRSSIPALLAPPALRGAALLAAAIAACAAPEPDGAPRVAPDPAEITAGEPEATIGWGPTEAWSQGAGLGQSRAEHTATLLPDGRVLLAGGFHLQVQIVIPMTITAFTLPDATLFDPGTGAFAQAAPMASARHRHTATLLPSGKVLVAGGIVKTWNVSSWTSSSLASAEIYDPAANTWTPAAPLGVVRYDHAAALLQDGRVLVVGGQGGIGQTSTRTAEIYDPASDTWTPAAQPGALRYWPEAAVLLDGRVLATGASGPYFSEIYDPASDTWTPTLSPGFGDHTSTRLLDGRVLVAGGSEAAVYDPAADTWTLAPGLIQRSPPQGIYSSNGIGGQAAVLLPDGRVALLGGREEMDTAEWVWCGTANCCSSYIYQIYYDSTQIYDPATNAWSLGLPLPVATGAHSATLLPGGGLLVAGGYEEGGCNEKEPTTARVFRRHGGLGAPCASALDCGSGFCAGGVCCNKACDWGPCAACSAAEGALQDGICTPATGTLCDDGDPGTPVDICQAGACVGGS